MSSTVAFGSNVDTNDPHKDLAAEQSETAIVAAGSTHTVVAAWNDASGFIVQPSTDRRASLTGFHPDGACFLEAGFVAGLNVVVAVGT